MSQMTVVRSVCLASASSVAGILALSAQVATPPLSVAFLRADGIVSVAFVITDSAVTRVRGDEDSLTNALSLRWLVLPSGGAPFRVNAGAMVHAFHVIESGSVPELGQITDGPRGEDWSWNGGRHEAVALGRTVSAAAFVLDSSSSSARDALLTRLRTLYVDTTARRALAKAFHREGPLAPSTPIRELRTWRAAIPETEDTLYVAQAERWYDEGSTTIFNLWAVQSHGRLRVIRLRGPETSDADYKGNPSEQPWAVFRLRGRILLVFERQFYLGIVPVLAEVLAGDSVRVTPR
jgi:hypothetical protein